MNKTNDFPDLTKYGYQAVNKLGQNKDSSIITRYGITIERNLPIVIKQFCFATKDSSWSGYQAYEKEVQLLKSLNHPGIPKYIADFETDNSFCFVREYIAGESLAQKNNLSETEIKKIAVRVLDILIYLQNRESPLFHLNITPQNILLDSQNRVYLIDFSQAQTASDRVNYNAIKTSNAEFIAPEQLETPSAASDNYGLGSTLNKLINNQQLLLASTDNFFAPNSQFKIDSGFKEWLTTMSEAEVKDRYSDAETALKALQNSSWEEIETVGNIDRDLTISDRAFTIGTIAMGVLGLAIALGIKVTQEYTEKSLVNITIALMGLVIIYLAQSASATLITNDNTEKKQGITLAVATPIILAVVTGIIFGRGEAVAMSLATVIAQTATLAYVMLQKLPLTQKENTLKVVSLVIAISFGLVSGVVIF